MRYRWRRAFIDRPLGRLRVVALVLPAVLISLLVGLDYFVLGDLLPPGQSHLVMLLIGVAGVVAFSVAIFGRLTELHESLQQRNVALEEVRRALERKQGQLRALNTAGLALSAEVATGSVLQQVVDQARLVANARYAALGVFDESGVVREFWTSGISPEERARIGDLPKGRGVLGTLQREGRPLRIRELAAHPDAVGFPPNHPPMKSFLGVPILSRGRNLGNLYLTEKIGAPEFDAGDEEALLTLAAQAAVAVENAQLYVRVQRVAALEERERIGMDLHDGAIQSLYGLGLLLDDAADRAAAEPDVARTALGRAAELVNRVITELRGYMLALRGYAPLTGKDLVESLEELAERTRHDALLVVDLDLDPAAEQGLDRERAEALVYVAADALANIARHARARHVDLRLRRGPGDVALEIADDGVGFDASRAASGHGLPNMARRIQAFGGDFDFESAPGRGTRIRARVPIPARMIR